MKKLSNNHQISKSSSLLPLIEINSHKLSIQINKSNSRNFTNEILCLPKIVN